jgi:Na+/H+-dicarboxylate symporter
MRVRRVVIGLIAGLIIGSAVGASHSAAALRVVDLIRPLGELWINAIRMTVVPLVIALLFVGVTAHESSDDVGRLARTTIGTFFALLVFAASVALLICPPLIADMKLSAGAAEALRATAASNGGAPAAVVVPTGFAGLAAWVVALVPTNVVQVAAGGAMLPLIVFTLLFALATRRIEPALRQSLVGFFDALAGATTRIVDWIILAAPIGVFALVLSAASRTGAALAGAMAYYVVACSAALLLFTLLLYPLATVVGRIPLGWFARTVLPSQAVALSSSSSLASLPTLVEGARAMELPLEVRGFVLPLSVATFKVATPITWLTGTLFLAKLYGVPLSAASMLTIALTAAALSFTIPGVPQGAQLLLAPVLVGYGIPAEGIALLIAVDTIPDLVGTLTNVTGDMIVAVIVGRRGGPAPLTVIEEYSA